MAKEKFPFLLDSKNSDVHVHYMYMLAVGNILSFGDFNMEKKNNFNRCQSMHLPGSQKTKKSIVSYIRNSKWSFAGVNRH